MSEPRIIVLTAPSGSGKSTIARHLIQALPQLRFSVSATTRPPRDHEHDGQHYHFISVDEFARLAQEEAFVEYEEVYPGLFYGTLFSEIERATSEKPVLLDIDVRGAENVKKMYGPDALVLFIRPPSLSALEERLKARGTETPESLRSRLERARGEMEYASSFDRVILNDRLDSAVEETIDSVRGFLSVPAENNIR